MRFSNKKELNNQNNDYIQPFLDEKSKKAYY